MPSTWYDDFASSGTKHRKLQQNLTVIVLLFKKKKILLTVCCIAFQTECVPVDNLVDLRLPVTLRVVRTHRWRGAEPIRARQPAVRGDVVAKQWILLKISGGSRCIEWTFVR